MSELNTASTIAPGMLVEHLLWGRGKAVEVSPPYVVIHFPSLFSSEQGPRRKLRLTAEQLSPSTAQSDPALDRVRVGPVARKKAESAAGPSPTSVKASARSLEDAVARFQADYPGLFVDPKLVREELNYKRAAHVRCVELFGDGRGRALVRSGALQEVASGLGELYHSTNLPSRFEIRAAHDGFKDPAAAGRVLEAALDFVDSPAATSFEALTEAIGSLPAPAGRARVLTWPNVTILPFLADPSRFMVLKPGVARQMAGRMGFDLLYSASPKWHCYEALQRMSVVLRDRLSVLGATDYIDVQSFMWVTRGLD